MFQSHDWPVICFSLSAHAPNLGGARANMLHGGFCVARMPRETQLGEYLQGAGPGCPAWAPVLYEGLFLLPLKMISSRF